MDGSLWTADSSHTSRKTNKMMGYRRGEGGVAGWEDYRLPEGSAIHGP